MNKGMNKENLELALKEKRVFESVKSGSVFRLPNYKVIKGQGIVKTGRHTLINIVRGTRIDDDGNEVFSVEGVTHETIISMMQEDLERKNEIFHDDTNAVVLEHLAAALAILEQRQRDRHERGVLATNKK